MLSSKSKDLSSIKSSEVLSSASSFSFFYLISLSFLSLSSSDSGLVCPLLMTAPLRYSEVLDWIETVSAFSSSLKSRLGFKGFVSITLESRGLMFEVVSSAYLWN